MKKVYTLILILNILSVIKVCGQVIWNGPLITFSETAGLSSPDQITTGVWLTRARSQGLYNAKTESSYTANVSPSGTEWAYGTLSNYATLNYLPWEAFNGKKPPSMINKDAVVHLINENIYIAIKFLSWESGAQGGDGGFSYQRTTVSLLPVTLKSFTATINNNNALLQWKTVTEINNQYFDIEHSNNGVNFSSVGRVNGSGNSTIEHAYTFTDNNITNGKHYYRLAQLDVNGLVKYSPIVLVSVSLKGKLQITPNPVASFINIVTSSTLKGSSYLIHSSAGQIIKKGILSEQQVDVQQLSPGEYWITVKGSDGETSSASFIKK